MSMVAAAPSRAERGASSMPAHFAEGCVIRRSWQAVIAAMLPDPRSAAPATGNVRIASPAAGRMMLGMPTLEPTSEASLEADIRSVAAGRDRAAFARVFAFYGPRVKAYLRRLGAEDAVAEDLTQEVMLAIWRRAHQFDRARAALSTWVYTIARNKRIDALRRERRPDFDLEDPALVGDADSSPRGDRVAEAGQAKREVMRAVAQLPAEQAELLHIFYFEEKPHSVIAAELGLPLGTVKSRLRLALGKLRVLMNGFNE